MSSVDPTIILLLVVLSGLLLTAIVVALVIWRRFRFQPQRIQRF